MLLISKLFLQTLSGSSRSFCLTQLLAALGNYWSACSRFRDLSSGQVELTNNNSEKDRENFMICGEPERVSTRTKNI